MDSLLYWLLFNTKRLQMRLVFKQTISEVSYDETKLISSLNTYLQKGTGSFDALPFKVVKEYSGTGFFYYIDGKYICPKQFAIQIGFAMVDLFNWYIQRYVSVEDRADMLNDCPALCDSILGTNISHGRYNPYELYFNFFQLAFVNKQYPRQSIDGEHDDLS